MKLELRDVLGHLDPIIEAAPTISGVFDNPNEAASFALRLTRLRELLRERNTAEPTLAEIGDHVFPGLKPSSRRVQFSNLRTTLRAVARATSQRFECVLPNVKGRKPEEIRCHFQGVPLPKYPELARNAKRAVGFVPRQPVIGARIAAFSGAVLERLAGEMHFKDEGGRRKVIFFVSYGHKDERLSKRLLEPLRTELAISKRFAFEFWQDKRIQIGNEWHQDIQSALHECDICLSLVSPEFLASDYIANHELPPVVSGQIPAVPVELAPVDFQRQNLRGLEARQLFTLQENGRARAFSECTGQVAARFVRELAARIEDRVESALRERTQSRLMEALADPEEFDKLRIAHPELDELLQPTKAHAERTSVAPATPRQISRAESLNKMVRTQISSELLKSCVDPRGAAMGLGEVDRLLRDCKGGDAPDAYERFRAHQRKALDFLREWLRDPEQPPFAAVLGEIGSGKTTMLRMLAHALASDSDAPPVIFVDLRDYQKSEDATLEGILAEHLRRYGEHADLTPDDILRAVRYEGALIIFDGLDEKIIPMEDGPRQAFIRELWRVLPGEAMDRPAVQGRGRLIISCRSHYFPTVRAQSSGYLGQARNEVSAGDYVACVMLPWSREQVEEYLTRVLGPDRVAAAVALIESVHNLKDLVPRPYLLSLIVPELEGLEQDRAAGKKINAAALYDRFVESWLNRDDGKHVFTHQHKRLMMEHLAAHLWRDNARELPWDRVTEWLDRFLYDHPVIDARYKRDGVSAHVLNQDFRTATFFLRPDSSADGFRFAHTSLQEYFLACHLVKGLVERAGGAAGEAWDVPMPSLDTLEFAGQILDTLPDRDREAALAGLAVLLGDADASRQARRAAFHYLLMAHRNGLPFPALSRLALAELDFTAVQICGTESKPLRLPRVDLQRAKLIRASFQHVEFVSGSRWTGSDLRGSEFISCALEQADYSGADTKLEGVLFRECRLGGSKTYGAPLDGVRVWRCLGADGSWPVLPKPGRASAQLQIGHAVWVRSIAFSPDGRQVVSGSGDGSLCMWDTTTGVCLRAFEGHTNEVGSVAFSSDGHQVLSASHDMSVRLWDAGSGTCRKVFEGHKHEVESIAFSPDGRQVVSGFADGSVRLWDVASEACLSVIEGHEEELRSLAFSPDGRLVLSGSHGGVRLWDAASGKCLRVFDGPGDEVRSVSFSPDGLQAISASEKRGVRLWDVATGECVRTLEGRNDLVFCTTFSPDGSQLLTGGGDGTVRLWLTASGECVRVFQHEDMVLTVAFSPDGNCFASGSVGGTFRLWQPSSGECLRTFVGSRSWVRVLAQSQDRLRVVSILDKCSFGLCDVESGECLGVFKGHENGVTSVAFSPDGRQVISGSYDGSVRLWEIASGECSRVLHGHDRAVRRVAFSPDGSCIVSLDVSGNKLCRFLTGEPMPKPDAADDWLRRAKPRTIPNVKVIGRRILRFTQRGRLLRDVVPLPDGQCVVLEPWDAEEAAKPPWACRWKLVRGPADAWRYVSAIDRQTGLVYPAEEATETGQWQIS